jgi:hypothetical protein
LLGSAVLSGVIASFLLDLLGYVAVLDGFALRFRIELLNLPDEVLFVHASTAGIDREANRSSSSSTMAVFFRFFGGSFEAASDGPAAVSSSFALRPTHVPIRCKR